MVERIEELKTQLQLSDFSEFELFEEAEVLIMTSWRRIGTRPAASKSAGRRLRKCRWIDITPCRRLGCDRQTVTRRSGKAVGQAVRIHGVVRASLRQVGCGHVEWVPRLHRNDGVELPTADQLRCRRAVVQHQSITSDRQLPLCIRHKTMALIEG